MQARTAVSSAAAKTAAGPSGHRSSCGGPSFLSAGCISPACSNFPSAIFCALFGSAVLLCILLHMASSSEGFAYSIFILTVLLISRFTTGYLFGTLAAVLSVVGTNYIFTYPYWAVNFTLSGYPLTFLTMLVVSLVTCTMTTKIKRQEDLRIEAAREKMRANLLRSVSHDIRTPLTSIIGSTSAMIENPDLPEEDRLLLLTDVRDDAQWLIRVVENLLSITRMGDTTTRLVKNPEPAEEILGAVTAKFRKRYPDVRIRVSVPEDLLFVPMDAVLISQVLSNLLENAVVHGGGHTTEIRLSVRREGPEAVFAVEDNGDGIEHKVLPHLFDGTLAAAAGDTENGGKRNMGLGLSVCQAIIHAHSGSIEAHNLMEGAEFVFRLPLEQEEEKA